MLANELKDVLFWGEFHEATQLGGHLYFAESLINKYSWTIEDKEKIRLLLSDISNKYEDKKLNLSIIGEFSNGKSTFINALLKSELLVSKVLQGTTVAATCIEQGDSFKIKLRYTDGSGEEFDFADSEELKNCLNTFTTDSQIAQKLHTVNVYLPQSGINPAVRIIDTPGTNVEQLWHEEVTIRTIREVSDTSVILIDATQVLPETMITFMRNHLEGILSKCVFVITKADLVRPREIPRLIEYVRLRLKQEFGLENPLVMEYASLEVLKNAGGSEEKIKKNLVDASLENEQKLYRFMSRQRGLIQANKIVEFAGQLYSYMEENLSGVMHEYNLEIENASDSLLPCREKYIEDQKKKLYPKYEKKLIGIRKDIQNKIRAHCEGFSEEIIAAFDKRNSPDEIKRFVYEDLMGAYVSKTEMISREIYALANSMVRELFISQINGFQKDFTALYGVKSEFIANMKPFEEFESYCIRRISSESNSEAKRLCNLIQTVAASSIDAISSKKSIFSSFSLKSSGENQDMKISAEKSRIAEIIAGEVKKRLDFLTHRILNDTDIFSERIKELVFEELSAHYDRHLEKIENKNKVMQSRIRFIKSCAENVRFDSERVKSRKIQIEKIKIDLMNRETNPDNVDFE